MATMESLYKDIDDSLLEKYLNGLVNKVFKLLPMREEKNDTLKKYHNSLMLELTGFSHLFAVYRDSQDFINLLSSLESLKIIEDVAVYKSKVFECINIVKKIERM
jgi:hypothetical protein